MKRQFLAAVSATILGLSLAPSLIVVAPTAAYAAKGKIGAEVGKRLQEAQKLAEAKQWSAAAAKAKEAAAVSGKSPYEEFVVNDFLTYVLVQTKDYNGAAAAAEAALNSGQAPKEDTARRVKLISQLYYQAKNSTKSIAYAERYMASYGYDQNMAELIAQSYYNQKNFAKALSSSLDLVKAADRAGQAPSEISLQLALSSAYNLKDKAQSKEILFRLVDHYPQPDYWTDLFNTLLGAPGNVERTNLEIFRAKFAAGQMADAEEYLEVGQTAVQLGLPGEAQRILEKGFAAGILGGGPDAGRHKRLLKLATDNAATDKATLASQIKAASASASGQDDIAVGEAVASYGQYEQALALVQAGLGKTGVKNMDEARITLGRIQLAMGQKDAARATFGQVKTDPKMMDVARLWRIVAKQL